MFEHFLQCPFCWEEISVLLDPSVRQQAYIEDCERCCNPLEIQVHFENEVLQNFEVRGIE